MIIRKVRKEDCDDMFEWLNDEQTRRASFNAPPRPVSYASHREWLKKSLKNSKRQIYIGENESGEKIGIVRMDKINKFAAECSINISPKMRGKGYGKGLITMACKQVDAKRNSILLIARTRKNNIASIKVFKKAGFFTIFDYSDAAWGDVMVLGKVMSRAGLERAQ